MSRLTLIESVSLDMYDDINNNKRMTLLKKQDFLIKHYLIHFIDYASWKYVSNENVKTHIFEINESRSCFRQNLTL